MHTNIERGDRYKKFMCIYIYINFLINMYIGLLYLTPLSLSVYIYVYIYK